jgi:hypothetical protein
MSDRTTGVLVLSLLLGLYAMAAGSLVAWSVLALDSSPPALLFVLDLVIVGSSAATALGAWRRAPWSELTLGLLLLALVASLWAHLVGSDGSLSLGRLGLGLVGTALLLALAHLAQRTLRRAARPDSPPPRPAA